MYGTYLRLNLHVSATPREVIRQTLSVIHPAHRRGPEKRDARHRLYSQMLTYHRKARETFFAVAGAACAAEYLDTYGDPK